MNTGIKTIAGLATKNDLMRKTFMGCKVVLTEGVAALGTLEQSEVIGLSRSLRISRPPMILVASMISGR